MKSVNGTYGIAHSHKLITEKVIWSKESPYSNLKFKLRDIIEK